MAREEHPAPAQVLQADSVPGSGWSLGALRFDTTSQSPSVRIEMRKGLAARDGVVLHRIVDQRLQRERRQQAVALRLVDGDVEEELVGVADAEQVGVGLRERSSSSSGTRVWRPLCNT